MGPIQSSLNQLTLTALGAVAGIAKGVKGGLIKPQVEEKEIEPATAWTGKKANYTVAMPKTSEYIANIAGQSGNDMIQQKYRASTKVFQQRLARIRKRKMGR